jgi:hypothetical protein
MPQAGRSRDRVPMRWIFCFLFPSSRTMALGSTQPLTEMSTKNHPGVKGGRRVRLTTLTPSDCVDKVWEPRRLTTLWAFATFYKDSFTLPLNRIPDFFLPCALLFRFHKMFIIFNLVPAPGGEKRLCLNSRLANS